ncbi:MAG TPA: hypothetical protein PKV85_06125, partial [Spirochaetota bacterium]|nr:hypothetical protein [Spirochaetota bacterium]
AKELHILIDLFADEISLHPSSSGWIKWFSQIEKKYPDLKALDEIRNIVLRNVYFPRNDSEAIKFLRNAVRVLKIKKKNWGN